MSRESQRIDAFEHAPTHDLSERAVSSGAIALTAQAGRFLLALLGTIALARLLTPRDFGLVAMAAAGLGLLATTKEFGLSLAVVQRRRISGAQLSTLFWVNVGFGLLLVGVALALAPALARLYGEPRLAGIAVALSAGFLIGGASVQHRALLQREMRFAALARVDLAALALGTSVAVVAACCGLGPWSLVVLALATEIAGAALLWRACPWRPGRPARARGVRALLVFGGQVSVANALAHLSRNLDKLLIGWTWGAASLGLYSKAYQLALVPIQQINGPLRGVAISALARLQAEPERYRRAYLRALRTIAWVSLPLFAIAAVLSREIVLVLLGEQWLGAIPIFAVLACAAGLQLIGNTVGWIFVSLGHTRRMLQWVSFASSAVVCAVVIGLPWGPLGVAVAYAGCVALLRVPHLVFALRGTPIAVSQVLRCVARPVASSLVFALAMALARVALEGLPLATVVSGTLAAGGAAFAALVLCWAGARRELGGLLALIHRLARVSLGGLRPVAADSA